MTLQIDFERINLDERNHTNSLSHPHKTPTKTLTPYAPVSPYSDDSSAPSPRPILCPASPARARRLKTQESDDSFGEIGNKIVMSEHKRMEVEGLFSEEPLLKDNPNRFVLFPIQEEEVS